MLGTAEDIRWQRLDNPIEVAADMAKCSVDDLIHFGATGKLPIYAIANLWHYDKFYDLGDDYIKEAIRDKNNPDDPLFRPLYGPVLLEPDCLKNKITQEYYGVSTATVSVDLTPFYSLLPEGIRRIVYRFREPVLLADAKLIITTRDLKLLLGIKDNHEEVENPRGGASRKSLLKMIIGLAVKHYGYATPNVKFEKLSNLVLALEGLGVEVGEDTIRKILKEAHPLLPPNDTKSPK